MTDEQIAEIAGKLTEAQKWCVRNEVCPRNQSTRLKLQSMGLIDAIGFYRPLGLAVRNHLENSRGTD